MLGHAGIAKEPAILVVFRSMEVFSDHPGDGRPGGEQSLLFRVLETAPMSTGKPVLTVTHELGIMDFPKGVADLSIAPIEKGVNLLKIKKIILDPVD